jgi:hypothetical protein
MLILAINAGNPLRIWITLIGHPKFLTTFGVGVRRKEMKNCLNVKLYASHVTLKKPEKIWDGMNMALELMYIVGAVVKFVSKQIEVLGKDIRKGNLMCGSLIGQSHKLLIC